MIKNIIFIANFSQTHFVSVCKWSGAIICYSSAFMRYVLILVHIVCVDSLMLRLNGTGYCESAVDMTLPLLFKTVGYE